MAIKQYGKHIVYSGEDCAPGYILVGDAMVPACTSPGCTGWVSWASRHNLCAQHERERQQKENS